MVIAVHDEGERALRTDQASGALDEGAGEGLVFHERPQRGALGSIPCAGLVHGHLQLAAEVVGECGTGEEDLIGQEPAHADVAGVGLGLELGEDSLLGSASLMEGDEMPGAEGMVGHDDLELEPGLVRNEEVVLEGRLVLELDTTSDTEEAVGVVPGLGFPGGVEEAEVGAGPVPPAAGLDEGLELGEALEGNGDGEADAGGVEGGDDGVTEEGGIEADLEVDAGKAALDLADTVEDEEDGAVGVVDVAGSVEEVEDLAGLGDGTEEGVVAAGAFFLFVEADGGPLGVPLGGTNGAVEVEGESGGEPGHETIEDEVFEETLEAVHAGAVRLGEGAAEGGDIGKAGESEEAKDHGVAVVEAGVAEFTVAEEEVDDELEGDAGEAVDGARGEVVEALAEAMLEVEVVEELLKDDEAGEGGKSLVLEAEMGYAVGTGVGGGAGEVHLGAVSFL